MDRRKQKACKLMERALQRSDSDSPAIASPNFGRSCRTAMSSKSESPERHRIIYISAKRLSAGPSARLGSAPKHPKQQGPSGSVCSITLLPLLGCLLAAGTNTTSLKPFRPLSHTLQHASDSKIEPRGLAVQNIFGPGTKELLAPNAHPVKEDLAVAEACNDIACRAKSMKQQSILWIAIMV